MPRQRRPPSQVWRTFLKNRAQDLIALDFFTVPTATFRVLFVLVVLSHGRRRLRHFNITEHPTADRCRCWGASRRLHSTIQNPFGAVFAIFVYNAWANLNAQAFTSLVPEGGEDRSMAFGSLRQNPRS